MKKIFLLSLLLLAEKSLAQQRGLYLDGTTSLFGLADPETGEPMTEPKFSFASHLEGTDSLVMAQKGGFWGLYAASGREIIPAVFESISHDRLGAGSMGFVTVFKNGMKGLSSLVDGRNLLAPEFEAVGAVSPNLIFCRKAGSNTLEFFDEKHRNRFQIEGQMVYPGPSAGDFNVLKIDGSMARFDDGGRDFSSGAQRVSTRAWIFQSLDKNGQPIAAFLLNEAGDTLIKNAFEIRKVGVVRFVVGLKKGAAVQFGLCDDGGKWLIPPSEKTIRPLGSPLAFANVVVLSDGNGNEQVWSKDGQLLLDSCRVGPPDSDRELTRRLSNPAANWYFKATKNGKNGTTGLFRLDGREVLPRAFTSITCASEKHAAIAVRHMLFGGFAANAYDLETGRKLFEEDFEWLIFTTDPQAFWAKKGGKWALVNHFTWRRLNPKFEVESVKRLPSGCFEIVENGIRKVTDPTGANVLATGLDHVFPPTRRQFEQFFERTAKRGRLAAVEIRRSDSQGWWRAIGLDGERFLVEGENPFKKVQVSHPDGTVLEKVAEPPMEEPSDEPRFFVEQAPKFPGGEAAMLTFLKKNLKYPLLAKENGIEGRVLTSFIVERDGSLTDVTLFLDIGGDCGKEALRLIGLMPKWEPGRQDGRLVRVKYNLPVQFKLD